MVPQPGSGMGIEQLLQMLQGGGQQAQQGMMPGGQQSAQQLQQMAQQLHPIVVQLLNQVLGQVPQRPAGTVPTSLPNSAVPNMAKQLTPEEQVLNMISSMLQRQQPQQNGMSGMQGFKGGAYGGLGGRPVGS